MRLSINDPRIAHWIIHLTSPDLGEASRSYKLGIYSIL